VPSAVPKGCVVPVITHRAQASVGHDGQPSQGEDLKDFLYLCPSSSLRLKVKKQLHPSGRNRQHQDNWSVPIKIIKKSTPHLVSNFGVQSEQAGASACPNHCAR